MTGPNKDVLQSVERAVRVLDCFGPGTPTLGVSEIARELQLGKTVVFRIVQTLVLTGLLERDANGGYRIGLHAFEIGSNFPMHRVLETAAADPLRELADRRRHSTYLAVLKGRHVTYLATAEAAGPIHVRATAGTRALAHATAPGVVLLAHLSDDEAREMLSRKPLERLTANTVVDVDRAVARLAEVRRRGFSFTRGEMYPETGSIAAPILGRDGRAIAAVSCGFAIGLVGEEEVDEIVRDVIECAASVTRGLGGARPEHDCAS